MHAGRKPRHLSLLKDKAVKLFLEAIKSPATREVCKPRLATFLEYVEMGVDSFVGEAKVQPGWAQEKMNYLLKEKEGAPRKEIEPSNVGNIKKLVKLLLEMKDVFGISWKKISRLLPSGRKYAIDRAPTIDELRLTLTNSDLRFQAILTTMASSGIRIGAWIISTGAMLNL